LRGPKQSALIIITSFIQIASSSLRGTKQSALIILLQSALIIITSFIQIASSSFLLLAMTARCASSLQKCSLSTFPHPPQHVRNIVATCFAQNIIAVILYGIAGEIQLLCYLRCGKSFFNPLQNFFFTLR
jgi:hypothetical protein